MNEPASERRDLRARAARDELGSILHIDPRNLVRVAGAEAASMVEGVLDERARNRQGVPLHVSLLRLVGMSRGAIES